MKLKEVLIVCSASSFGWIIGDIANSRGSSQSKVMSIPPPYQIQQMLREEGYELSVDGKIGPETMKCWNDYFEKHSEQMANELTKQEME